MSSIDNPRLPLTSGQRSIVKYTETEMSNRNRSSDTTITFDPMDLSRNQTRRKTLSVQYNDGELRRMPTRQRRVVKKTLMANVGYRLGKRKVLHIRRFEQRYSLYDKVLLFFCFIDSSRFVGDIMCFLGMLGIILMIFECELTFRHMEYKETTFSFMLKATITFTTLILVGLVFYYHRIDLTLYCVDNSIDDWRIVLTRKKLFAIIFEAFICLIHPIPGHFIIEWSSQYVKHVENGINFINSFPSSLINFNSTSNPTSSTSISAQHYVPIDVILSIPSKHSNRMKVCFFSFSSSVFPFVSRLSITYVTFSFGS